MGGLGLTCARDIAPAAYATSLLTAQDLKLRILGRTEQYSPANIKPALITYLGAKMGEEVTTDSLTGVTQRAVIQPHNQPTQVTASYKPNRWAGQCM